MVELEEAERLYGRGLELSIKFFRTRKSDSEMMQCYEEAAKAGHMKAINELAFQYYVGNKATEQDDKKFVFWYQKALELFDIDTLRSDSSFKYCEDYYNELKKSAPELFKPKEMKKTVKEEHPVFIGDTILDYVETVLRDYNINFKREVEDGFHNISASYVDDDDNETSLVMIGMHEDSDLLDFAVVFHNVLNPDFSIVKQFNKKFSRESIELSMDEKERILLVEFSTGNFEEENIKKCIDEIFAMNNFEHETSEYILLLLNEPKAKENAFTNEKLLDILEKLKENGDFKTADIGMREYEGLGEIASMFVEEPIEDVDPIKALAFYGLNNESAVCVRGISGIPEDFELSEELEESINSFNDENSEAGRTIVVAGSQIYVELIRKNLGDKDLINELEEMNDEIGKGDSQAIMDKLYEYIESCYFNDESVDEESEEASYSWDLVQIRDDIEDFLDDNYDDLRFRLYYADNSREELCCESTAPVNLYNEDFKIEFMLRKDCTAYLYITCLKNVIETSRKALKNYVKAFKENESEKFPNLELYVIDNDEGTERQIECGFVGRKLVNLDKVFAFFKDSIDSFIDFGDNYKYLDLMLGLSEKGDLSKLPSVSSLEKLYEDVEDVDAHDNIDLLEEAVVGIRDGNGEGSGFFISPDGLIVTAAHCCGVNNLEIVNFTKDRRGNSIKAVYPAEVVIKNIEADVAILRVTEKLENLPFIALERKDAKELKPLHKILVIGYPFGFSRFSNLSVNEGKIASYQTNRYSGLRQINLDISAKQGNSGSCIIDAENSRVIGILNGSEMEGLGEKGVEEINYSRPVSYIWDLLKK